LQALLHSCATGGSSSGSATTSSSIVAGRASPLVLPVGDVGTLDSNRSTSGAGIGGGSISTAAINDTAGDSITTQQKRVIEGTRMVIECGDAAVGVTKTTTNGTSAKIPTQSSGDTQSMDIDADVNSSGAMDTQHDDQVTTQSFHSLASCYTFVHIIGHDSCELTNFFSHHVS
jgi:hypothetical protein